MTFKKILLIGFLLSNYLMANGANWFPMSASSLVDKEKNYFDANTITGYYFDYDYAKNKGYYITAWLKTDYPTAQKLNNGKLYRQVKQLNYFDCNSNKIGFGDMVFYTSNGKLVASQNIYIPTYSSDSWQKIIPDTVGEMKLLEVCNYYKNSIVTY